MPEFEFVEELPSRPQKGGRARDPVVTAFADALRNNPGRWAKYPKPLARSTANTLQWALKDGKHPAPLSLRDGFEGATRDGILYVRYKGRG